jgi:phytoene dehydrogenase-like protein
MARYDVVVIGAGLGGLTAGAILARARCKVLVIERSGSVGGAASSYKSGDLFIGYTGGVQSAGACADLILRER